MGPTTHRTGEMVYLIKDISKIHIYLKYISKVYLSISKVYISKVHRELLKLNSNTKKNNPFKIGKGFHRYFSKEDTGIAKKPMKMIVSIINQ